jgi:hypothetical protein
LPARAAFFVRKGQVVTPKPILQALLVADRVYEDKFSGKKIIAGIFHTLNFIRKDTFDAEVSKNSGNMPIIAGGFSAGSPYAYASMTAVRGEQEFVLRYVDLSDESVHFQYDFKVNCKDPLASVEVVLPLPPLSTQKAGTFALELLWNDEPLGSCRINVREIKKKGDENAD